MLASIHPLGERARGNRFGITAGAFVLASTAAGAALGLLLGAFGAVASARSGAWSTMAPWALACGAAVALATDLGLFGLRPLGPRRQVDEDWMEDYRGWVYGAGFGAQLGVGVVTIVTTAAVHLAFLAALLVAAPGRGGLIGGVFGLVRGATLLTAAGVDSPQRLRALHRRMDALSPVSHTLVVAAEAAVVVAALALGARG